MLRTLALGLLLAACSKAGDGDTSGTQGSPRDAVISAWKAGKITPSTLAPASVAFAKDCQSGTVDGIELLLCNFASPAEAKSAEEPALAWIGSATGSSQAHGAALVVLVDRKKVDPNGRTINRLMKLAPH